MTPRSAAQPPTLEPDAPFVARLRERFIYLRNRRWVQMSLAVVILALAIWGFFYVRSLLPRTPPQTLAAQADKVHTYLRLHEALIKLGLIRAMIEVDLEPSSIERYRNLIATDLELTFKRAPRELRKQWRGLEREFNSLQANLNTGKDEALAALTELEITLQAVE
jgi:hypothetical protein